MIKIKLGQIVEAEPIFAKLDALSKSEKFSFKLAYKIGKLIKKIQPELQDFYAEKQKLLTKYGTEVIKDGQPTTEYSVDNVEEFMKYMNILLSIDIELSNVFPLTEEELVEVEGLTIEDTLRFEKFLETKKPIEEETERTKIKLEIE